MSSRSTAAKLKYLETRLSEQRIKCDELDKDIEEKKKLSFKEQKIFSKLKQEIIEFKKREKGLIVSEHAMLRYITRVIGIDLKTIISKILPGGNAILMNGKYPVEGGFTIVVKNGVVVTIETSEDKNGEI